MKTKPEPYLPDGKYQKLVGQLRLQFNGVFENFRMHGMDVYIPGGIAESVKLCENFCMIVRGVDKPLSLEIVKKSLSKKRKK